MYNRESLERQLADLEARKEALFESGNGDQVAISRLNEQITEVRMQLNASKANEEVAEGIAEEIRTSEFPFILKVGGEEINFRDWIREEENYQVIAIGVSQKIHELNTYAKEQYELLNRQRDKEGEQYRAQLTAADEAADARYNDLHDQFEALKASSQLITIERDRLKEENHTLRTERDDFERKHQAAVSEVESLKTQLQEAQMKNETPKNTNLDNGALAEALRKAQAAKTAIYNVVKDTANINFTANILETDAEITGKVVYIGQYRIASEAEVERFRQERENTPTETPEEHSEDNTTLVEVPDLESFRPNEDDNTGRELDRDSVEAESGPNHDGGETFEQQVMRRLATLETAVYGEVREAA